MALQESNSLWLIVSCSDVYVDNAYCLGQYLKDILTKLPWNLCHNIP